MPASNSAREKNIVMESKIMIDINYASREPQIVINEKSSDDPRDKLVSMFTGQAMPGVRDGYCRIERYPSSDGTTQIVITPLHPLDAIGHIPIIAQFAKENATCDTSSVANRIQKIIGELTSNSKNIINELASEIKVPTLGEELNENLTTK